MLAMGCCSASGATIPTETSGIWWTAFDKLLKPQGKTWRVNGEPLVVLDDNTRLHRSIGDKTIACDAPPDMSTPRLGGWCR